MSFIWAAITGAFSGLAQGFLSLFGMSDAQKLGRAQVQNADLKAEVKELQDGSKIENRVLSEPAGTAEQWLHTHKPGNN
jgi:hypothetical protein